MSSIMKTMLSYLSHYKKHYISMGVVVLASSYFVWYSRHRTPKKFVNPGDVMAASTLSVAQHCLSRYVNLKADHKTSLEELVKNSNIFPMKPPVSSILCDTLLKSGKGITSNQLEDYINSAYPLVHEEALFLYMNFLEHKKKFGTNVEKDLYANMELTDFVERLLKNRAVAFFGQGDSYLLLNQHKGYGGWESIGQNNEKSPLILADCISYDEVKLSAFLSVTSQSVFINDGNRYNRGEPSDDESSFQKNGIIIGLIGARLEKPDVMDWQEVIVSADQNTKTNGYGAEKDEDGIHQWRRLWANFYKLPSLPAYDEVKESRRFIKLDELLYFDNDVFKKRVALSVETLLLEAEHRAATGNTNAYVNVVGIGLGVWSISPHQDELFLESFVDCLKRLSPVLKHVSDVHFLWFKTEQCIGMPEGEKKEIKRDDGSSIRIHFSRGAPHARLENENADKLLVVSYAWDGNALPGNEFWMGALDSSGDPAAACATQVAELHNPHVNQGRVSGSNLHVASRKWGVLHISEFAQKKLENMKEPLESNEVEETKLHEVSSALPVMFNPATKDYLSEFSVISDQSTSIKELCKYSSKFPRQFPVVAMLCSNLKKRDYITDEKLTHCINSAYPLVHEAALHLYINFLEHKKNFGSDKEKLLYANMGLTDFVQRLLDKRAVVFCGRSDIYLLLKGKEGQGNWEQVGKSTEKAPLILANCLSYDEMKLSAFLSVSSHSFFINDGNRYNKGVPASKNSNFQKEGVIVGMIGSRLEKPGFMDWQELVVSVKQNTDLNGYGPPKDSAHQWRKLWAEFYDVSPNLPSYQEALTREAGNYTELPNGLLFDNNIYKKRVALVAETLLLEAEHKAAACNTDAYVNVVGVGLGVWRLCSHQERLYLESFLECLKSLANVLNHVSDVHFLWLKTQYHGENKISKGKDGSYIYIHFSNGAPHEELVNENTGKLLVVSYAWDGNALPGNEFWRGALDSSGDPAAACSTQVAELHNPHVNRKRVSGSNLHVATPHWGILHISDYAQRKLKEQK